MKRKILIADDDSVSRSLLSMLLEDDYIVFSSEDGSDCLQKIDTCSPDLLILDVRMPGLDGDEVCYNLKRSASTKHIPIVFLTSMDKEEYEAMYGEIGAEAYITKPIDQALLRQTVEKVLKQPVAKVV